MADVPLLVLDDVHVRFEAGAGLVHAVRGVSLRLDAGEVLAVVGESGSGKSALAKAVVRQHQPPFTPPVARTSGRILLSCPDGVRDLAAVDETELRGVRAGQVGLVPQDALSALNPVMPVGAQVAEALLCRDPGLSRRSAGARAVDMLAETGLADPHARSRAFPHQLSGGQRQRVVIAMAAIRRPRLMIADEPTTALDVTMQRRILDLLMRLQADSGMAMLFITHDLGVVAEIADRVAVMYAGRIVESGPVEEVLGAPAHPYTQGLLASLPGRRDRKAALRGFAPEPRSLPTGCAFRPRCPASAVACETAPPLCRLGARQVECWTAA